MRDPAAGLFEIVPNISEGRDPAIVDACVDAMRAEGAEVVHRTSDRVHHRSVITAVGRPSQVVAAAVALARVARERIDLRVHHGVHPRIGALDVLPFVPLADATLDDAVTLAHRAAGRIWCDLAIPSFLYGAAASAPHRTQLAEIRRGEFEGLAARHALDAAWSFDYGDAAHASAGAIAIGARPFLVAFNVELACGDVRIAQRIARRLRASGGGLRTLKCLGLQVAPDRVQVSCNLTDVDAVPLYRLTELVRRAAARDGVAVARTELIGLAPQRVLERTARAYAAAGVDGPAGGHRRHSAERG
ncbi:glutamate formiminotransferase [Vulcanimicrobium alpinum]|uniref:glutamate formimidoyltransferase n=1 Tax=Vulcanimicrobium alpinum TaxID=3016050 RepID=A0AAN1XVD7_UNVUL|nr:glutamate formimidoyltransferase [Vulcanimicrobium alpinum]BDE06125.1 glutamate formiminotransferase [Vulcanimicrobium alpinum]